MQLTDAERLSLTMLAEIHEAIGIKNGINARLVKDAIWGGNEWAIYWDVPLPWTQQAGNPAHVEHVADVFDMYSFLEAGYGALSPQSKAAVDQATGRQGGPKFPGFDGNNETDEYSAGKFLIDEMGRFGSYKGRAMNSHHPTVDRSNRMLAVFKPIRDSMAMRHPIVMTDQEIIAVMTA